MEGAGRRSNTMSGATLARDDSRMLSPGGVLESRHDVDVLRTSVGTHTPSIFPPRLTGEVPPKGVEGESLSDDFENAMI
jgi:hypothetical protein